MAIHILTTIVNILDYVISDLFSDVINGSSIHRYQENFCEFIFLGFKPHFLKIKSTVVVHQDYKLLPALKTTRSLINSRSLPVIILQIRDFLTFQKLHLVQETIKRLKYLVCQKNENFREKYCVKLLCYTITTSNTERLQRACILLEQLLLESDILNFSCIRMHHIVYKLVLKCVYEKNNQI